MLGIERHTLFSALRFELGEMVGRPHFHCLLGNTKTQNRITDSHRLGAVWRTVSSGGIDDVRLYDRLRNGPEYLAETLGANSHEVGKYSLAESTTLSHSVVRYLSNLDGINLKLQRMRGKAAEAALRGVAHTRKNGAVGDPGGHKQAAYVLNASPGGPFTNDATLQDGHQQTELCLRVACPPRFGSD